MQSLIKPGNPLAKIGKILLDAGKPKTTNLFTWQEISMEIPITGYDPKWTDTCQDSTRHVGEETSKNWKFFEQQWHVINKLSLIETYALSVSLSGCVLKQIPDFEMV